MVIELKSDNLPIPNIGISSISTKLCANFTELNSMVFIIWPEDGSVNSISE